MKIWQLTLDSGFYPGWVKVIQEVFDHIAEQHPEWQQHALEFYIKHKFTQVSSVRIHCDNEAFMSYLVSQFGHHNLAGNWQEYDNYPIPYRLNRTCEWCGAPALAGQKCGINQCPDCASLLLAYVDRPRSRYQLTRNERGEWQ